MGRALLNPRDSPEEGHLQGESTGPAAGKPARLGLPLPSTPSRRGSLPQHAAPRRGPTPLCQNDFPTGYSTTATEPPPGTASSPPAPLPTGTSITAWAAATSTTRPQMKPALDSFPGQLPASSYIFIDQRSHLLVRQRQRDTDDSYSSPAAASTK